MSFQTSSQYFFPYDTNVSLVPSKNGWWTKLPSSGSNEKKARGDQDPIVLFLFYVSITPNSQPDPTLTLMLASHANLGCMGTDDATTALHGVSVIVRSTNTYIIAGTDGQHGLDRIQTFRSVATTTSLSEHSRRHYCLAQFLSHYALGVKRSFHVSL
jgi:hypothetical protein